MPTRRVLPSFRRDWQGLTPQQQRTFLAALRQFISDLKTPEQGFHPRLRVKRMQGHPGIWEMSGRRMVGQPLNTAMRSTPGRRTSSGGGSELTRSSVGPSPSIQPSPAIQPSSSTGSDPKRRSNSSALIGCSPYRARISSTEVTMNTLSASSTKPWATNGPVVPRNNRFQPDSAGIESAGKSPFKRL